MKKFGFTLSEVIIALAVVGVLSAIAAPMLGSLMPDKNKAIVLKTHKTITDITKDLLDDPRMYRDYTNASDYTYVGLSSIGSAGTNEEYEKIYPYLWKEYGNEIRGKNAGKYPFLFSKRLELQDEVSYTGVNASFTTVDGLYWTFKGGYPAPQPDKTYKLGYEISVILDYEPLKLPNGKFSSLALLKKITPDTFVFKVDTYGKVTAGDALTAAYLENPDKLNDKKKDYARAKELLSKY